jgi:alpha 1,2-mannosyltransferase
VKGFVLKVFAILFSSFRDILYLDADNNVVRDPRYMFENESYKQKGALFWHDFWLLKKVKVRYMSDYYIRLLEK